MLTFDAAGVSPELGNHFARGAGDFNVINAAAPGAVQLAGRGCEVVAQLARGQKADRAGLGHDPLIIAVAGVGKGGIGKGEYHTTMTYPMAVEHVLRNLHRHIGLSGRDMGDTQPERLTGRIMSAQGLRGFFGNLLRS